MITVVGYDGGPLSALAQERLAAAALVMGGRRHLQEVALPEGVRTIALRDDPSAAVAAVADEPGDVVVLASGDPGFFGVVRAVRKAVRPRTVEVLPGLTSIALAFGRAGHEWDDAVVVSAHGRDPREALAAVRSQPKVAVLTDATTGPAQIGAALAGRIDRVLLVGERLGLPGETVSWVCPDEAAARTWEDPNVVVVLDTGDPEPGPRVTVAGFRSPDRWALPEEAFGHRDSMVTKSEVRALVLARLGPRLGEVVWDVGAASGSVGIECARFGADVHAVEQGSCDHLRANAAAHGVHVHVVEGRAPDAVAGLPDPDAAFVGGGGLEVVAAVAARRPRRLVVALAALERVQPTLEAMAAYETEAVLLQAQRLVPLAGSHRLAPTNPVFVVSGVLP
ncbi:MAG: precorrin-6y C5,15-methyltransferase (decarboxylating), CbiE subunit [Frankiales bacterium]|nr:precorrin-6y C5,15-methyltransferase (decarboxylating), CbiE subunit [Frankiales bacterium]